MPTDEEKKLAPVVRLNPEALRRIKEMKSETPRVEAQLKTLSKYVDISPIMEKIKWAKEIAKDLEEGFGSVEP